MGGFSDAIASEWYEKGRMKTLIENVQAFMAAGMSLEDIVRILKLDEETVEILRQKIH